MMLGATRNKAQILSSASPTPSLHLLNPRIRTQQAHDDNARRQPHLRLCPGDLRHVTDVDRDPPDLRRPRQHR